MSNNDFVKGECGACGGHLEFPWHAAGQTIDCPHCRFPTELRSKGAVPPKPVKHPVWPWVALAALLLLGAGAAVWALKKPGATALKTATSAGTTNHPAALVATNLPAKATVTNLPVVATSPVGDQPVAGETLTNDFGISGGQLEKTADSSLIYLTGQVRNPTDRQRFGVKIEFALCNAEGAVIGKATDYQNVLEAHGAWSFKALVIESKAVSARFTGIREEQ